MIKKILTTIFYGMVIVLFAGDKALADTYVMPKLLYGQTIATVGGQTVYSGNEGNYAVLNRTAGDNYGFDFKPFSTDLCKYGHSLDRLCFLFGSYDPKKSTNFTYVQDKILTSRTFVIDDDGKSSAALEVPVLFAGRNFVAGDVYSGSYLGGLSFWGQNLHQKETTDSDATWQLHDYILNKDAQGSMDSTGIAYQQYVSKVSEMMRNANTFMAGSWNGYTDLYLQGSGALGLNDNSNSGTGLAPEGKVWLYDDGSVTGAGNVKIGNITATTSKTMHGVGTIIVNGDLTIANGTTIKPYDSGSKIGFIVTGNVTVGSNCNIQAAIFSEGTINVNGNNNKFTGSFVAQKFTGLNNHNNNQFYYDFNFDKSWPPGFRYLNMPKPAE